jgi:hypothetical protein
LKIIFEIMPDKKYLKLIKSTIFAPASKYNLS